VRERLGHAPSFIDPPPRCDGTHPNAPVLT